MAKSEPLEVTFITRDAQFVIRLTGNTSNDICKAAESLKARFAVFIDEWDQTRALPIWSVIEVSKAQNHGNVIGWSLPIPVRQFHHKTSDPAVMFALAKVSQQ